jgi:hypothetical protein
MEAPFFEAVRVERSRDTRPSEDEANHLDFARWGFSTSLEANGEKRAGDIGTSAALFKPLRLC